jgi:phenylpropionate dioxygenase-like ring-hydroxylating dioxygenase large terminal subunit
MLAEPISTNATAFETTPLVAGGPEPSQFDPKEAWYPIFYIEDLEKTTLAKFTLLDQDLVIWWDDVAATWRAFVDQCPHRLVPLSEGRLTADGLLECPYHGWAFAGSGDCNRIPQQTEAGLAHQSARACATTLPTTVEQGLLFVYPGQPANAGRTAIPLLTPLAETPADWVCLNTFRDLPYDALTLLENVLDSSHVPFTHHGTVGNRRNAAPVELELQEFGRQGFTGLWEEGPRKGTLGRQTTTFIAPNLMWHDLTSKQFGRTITAVYATPTRKGECRLFARFPFKFSSKFPGWVMKLTPQWYSHLSQNGILEDDQIFLHYQERYLVQKGGSPEFARAFYLPTRADTFVMALRKWVNEYEADPFPGQSLPPLQSTAALLNRYDSHTRHCRSCRTALKNIQRLKWAAAMVGALVWLGLPLGCLTLGASNLGLVLAGMGMAVVAAGLWLGLHRLERRFYSGDPIPVRNLPEVKSKTKPT